MSLLSRSGGRRRLFAPLACNFIIARSPEKSTLRALRHPNMPPRPILQKRKNHPVPRVSHPALCIYFAPDMQELCNSRFFVPIMFYTKYFYLS